MSRPIGTVGRRSRGRWLSASSLALATAMLHPAPLLAQPTTTAAGIAVQASATYESKTAIYTAGENKDVVDVQVSDLLINWVPFDTATSTAPIMFLEDGKTLEFRSGAAGYTVVNRILPSDATRAVRFDGQVTSLIFGGEQVGGNIYFYSPGGIIVGSTGRFDVGSLVLTTSDIAAGGSTLGFAASNPGSFVRIEPWAANGAGDTSPQIELINQGSFLALVAPRVEQHGRVDVNGSIAYVAAESATLTINNGLFDIVVGTGTDDANGIVHTGNTTGPSSTGTDDNQRTYLTAISKNDAITMLVTGQLGYAQAATATADNGSIQLLAQTQNPSGGGNIEVGATDFSADVLIAASDTISLTADGIGNDINFGSATNRVDVDLFSLNQIDLNATSGGNVTVFGDLSMYAGNFTTGGIINIAVDDAGRNDDAIVNGLIVVGDFRAAVNAVGASVSGPGGIGGDAAGGTINVDVNTGGDVLFRSNVTFDASAQAGFGEGQAGKATGGNVNISMTGVNSRFGMTNEFGVEGLIDTSGKAAVNPFDGPSTAEQGGTAVGGNVMLSLLDGRSAFGNLTIDTSAEASSGIDDTIAQDNGAFAGDVTIDFSGRTHDILGTLAIDASSTTGSSFDGAGNPIGGTSDRALVDIGIDGADVTIGAVAIDASTQGNISGAAAGDAITFAATNGATFLTTSFSADASHNNRESAEDSRSGGIAISADGSSLELGDTALTADNSTLAAAITRASNKRAGDISLSATGGSSIVGGSLAISAQVTIRTSAVGAAEHTGGDVTLLADASTIAFTGTGIDTTVDVPRGGDMSGLTSAGGAVLLQQIGADAAMSFGSLGIATRADGSFSADDFVGDGGNAAGGEVTIDVRGGTFTASPLTVDTSASGHIGGAQVASAGDTAGSGGSAQAGDITLVAAGESVSTGRLSLFASAFGGEGGGASAATGAARAGDGGAATGGTVDIQALSGQLDINNTFFFLEVAAFGPSPVPLGALVVNASAVGGTGGFGSGTAGGNGGAATGGTAAFAVDGGTVSLTTPTLALVANATGGTGGGTGTDEISGAEGGAAGAGGTATGGTASYAITGGATNLTTVILDASATGGTGGNHSGSVAAGGAGGDAFGGTATATLGVDDATGASFTLNATALGGAGGIGAFGLAGGAARGGAATFTVADAAVDLGALVVDASGLGGDGGVPGAVSGAGGDGGEGVGGTASVDVFGLAGALAADGGIEITSTGQGGAGAAGYGYFGSADGGDGGAGGRGVGGTISLQSRDGASFSLSTAGLIDARGFGGAGGDGGYTYDGYGGAGGQGGSAKGGAVDLSAAGGGTLSASNVETGTTTLAASAVGGLGGDGGTAPLGPDVPPTPGGNGAAEGGSVSLIAAGPGSLLSFAGDLIADASVSGQFDGRANSSGADATGGAITVDVADGGALSVTGNLGLDAGALATIARLSLGNAVGGTVNLTMVGPASSLAIGNGLTIDASAFEPRTGGFSFANATGGDTSGGAATLDFADGTATVAGDLLINVSAGFETSESAGRGGTAIAGDVSIFNDGAAVVSLDNLIVQAFARGSYGSYYGEGGGGGPGGAGGAAFGGNILISNQGTGSLAATSISLDSGATGGRGGDGVGGEGGAGGDGTAGTASLVNGSDLAVQDLTIIANGLGGTGGRGSSGFSGGVGGQGIGGAVGLSTATTLPPLNTLALAAIGTGGSGNTSSGDFTTGGGGSQGGDGVGGSVLLELTGAGTVLPGVAEFSADVSGIGGTGGAGAYGNSYGGDGGGGGAGTGGRLTLAARSGATIDLTGFLPSLEANGVGGTGGAGGRVSYYGGVEGGAGGNGGIGAGGELSLVAQGGSILSGDIELTAAGTGGLGGLGGYSTAGSGGYSYHSYGADGAGGGGIGGLVSLQALEGSPGVISLGAVTIDASGFAGGGDISIPTTGGSIEIIDASTDPAGLITMGSLTATALGAVPPAEASFTMSGDSGPISVTGDATVDVAGDVDFVFAGTGQLAVGGATTLTAGGDITLTHTDNSLPTTSIDSTGNFTAVAGGDFVGGAGSIVASGAALTITAQNISYGSLNAGTNLTLNAINGSIIGIAELLALGAIDLDATGSILIEDADAETGFTADAGSDVGFATITNSSGDLAVNAGGDIIGGSAINDAPAGSGGLDRVVLAAGGDIALTGTAQSIDDGVILTAGGAIAAGTLAAGGEIQAIAGGAVDVGTANTTDAGFTALLQGTSVTLDDGTIAGSLRLNATAGDVGGTGTIVVGQTVDLDATGDIGFGSIAAGTGFTADAGGSILFGDASTADNDLTFVAGGDISGGSASNLAADGSGGDDSVSLTAGGDVTLTGSGRAENSFIVRGATIELATINAALGGVGALDVRGTGAVTVASAATGGSAAALIEGAGVALDGGDVGGDLRLNATSGSIVGAGAITVGGAADLDATGSIAFGSIAAGAGFTANAGGDIAFGDASTADNNLVFVAGGDISGESASNLAADGSGGDDAVSLAAGGDVTLTGTSRAENSYIVRATNVTLGTLNGATGGAGTIDVQGTGAVAVDSATTGGAAAALFRGTAVTLGSGAIGGNLTVDATAGDIDLSGAIAVGGMADLDATGNIAFGSITAGTGFTADAGGNLTFVDAASSDDNLVFVAGGDITGNSASNLAAGGSGGDDSVSLTAGGNVTLTGSSQAENNLSVSAGGAIAGGSFVAGDQLSLDGASIAILAGSGAAIGLTSGGDILFDQLTSSNAITLSAADGTIGGNTGAGDIDSGGNVSLTAQAIALGDLASGGLVDATASAGGASFGAIDSEGNTTITGAAIALGNATVGGTLLLTATAGDIDAGGTITVDGAADFDASGSVTLGRLDAGGAFTVDAAGAIMFDRATSAISLAMNAGGAILGGDLGVAGPLTLSGATIAIGDAEADSMTLTSDADILFDAIIGGGALELTAANGTIGANTGPGNVSADGDVTLLAQHIALGDVTSGGSVGATATVGGASFGTIDAAGDIVVSAASTPTIANAISGGDTSITGTAVTLAHGTISGNLSLTATTGDIDADGAVTVGGGIAFDAPGDVIFGTLAAQGGDFTVVAGGAIGFTGASAGGDLAFDAEGAIAGGDVTADGAIALDAASLSLGNLAASRAALGSAGDVDFGNATLGGGDLDVLAGGAIALGDVAGAGDIDISAGTTLGFGSLGASGAISLLAQGALTGVSATAGGDLAFDGTSVALTGATAGGDLSGNAESGDLGLVGGAAGGSIFLQAAGSVVSASLDAGSGIAVQAGGDIAAGSMAADDAILGIAGGTLTAQSATAGDALDLRAGSTLTIGDAVGGTVALRSANGAVIVTHDIDSTFAGDGQQVVVSGAAVQIDDVNDLVLTLVQATDGDIDATAAGDIGVLTAESAGDINLASTAGDVRVGIAEAGKVGIVPAAIPGAIGPAGTEVGNPGPGHISVSAAGLAQGRFIATGDIAITAGTTIDLDGADAGGSIALGSGGSTRVFGTAAAGADIDIQSGGDVRVTNSEASLEAGGDLTVDAQGAFDTQGFAYGAAVSITAADVVIGSSGQIGDGELTRSITFTGTRGPIFLGGETEAGAFTIDADEFGRIRGTGDVSILARGVDQQEGAGIMPASHAGTSGRGDIVVRDLDVLVGSGGSVGAEGTLLLDAQGELSIVGALAMTGGGGDTNLDLRAGDLVWLDTAGGNLRIERADGAPTGQIDISARRFIAASEDALADIEGLSAADIDARLAQNDGVVRDEGFLQAGSLEVRVDEALLIQNSGESTEFDDRRGFAVDFLAIDSSESANPLIVVNGTVRGATGAEALAAIEIAGGVDAGSTVNGCLIANPANCAVQPPPPGFELDFFDPARDVIEEEIDPGLDPDSLDLESQLIDFTMPEEFEDDPLIDDPVTGAGNEDLWIGEPDCEPGEGEVCPVGEGEEAEPAE